MYPIARFLSRCVFFSGGVQWITVVGRPDMKVPIMAVAPHSGFFDVLFTTYLNFVTVVGRKGADEVLLFGNLTKMTQPIIVEREKHQSRTDSIKQIIDRVNSKEDWPPVSLFCEGTCSNRKALVQFKAGAFVAGMPVQPVCIKYPNKLDTTSWTWEGPHPFTLVWLTMCQIHTPIEFHFLPVYHPNEEEKQNAELYGENVRKIMGAYLKVPLSNYSFDDGRLLTKSQQCKLPWKMGAIKIHDLRKSLG